jgi:CheY-like chemotaxis protein
MSLHFSLEQMTHLREDARQLLAQAAETESSLLALLAASGNDSATTQDVLRELCVQARQQQVALDRLVTDLGDRRPAAGPERPRPHAVRGVDDYVDSREWLAMLLLNAGFIVSTAANGLEAVLAAHKLQPTVILMDLAMPVLSGIEAARLIKAIDALRGARLIAYTAQSAAATPLHGDLFTAVLPKPSPPDEILAAVQRYAAAP